jgi:hypothetical protein
MTTNFTPLWLPRSSASSPRVTPTWRDGNGGKVRHLLGRYLVIGAGPWARHCDRRWVVGKALGYILACAHVRVLHFIAPVIMPAAKWLVKALGKCQRSAILEVSVAQAITQEAMMLRPRSRPGDPGGRTLASSEPARTPDRGDGYGTPGR